jgi:hypothetical protein
MGGRRDERLESGSWSLRSVSSPESSSDDGVGGRRAGGNFSPSAIVRVGGGGSLPKPLGLRSGIEETATSGVAVLGRTGKRGGGGCIESSSGAAVERRMGKGGGICKEDAELGESEFMVPRFVLGRGGGGGGTITDGRDGCAELAFGKLKSILVSSLSGEASMRLELLEIVLSDDCC